MNLQFLGYRYGYQSFEPGNNKSGNSNILTLEQPEFSIRISPFLLFLKVDILTQNGTEQNQTLFSIIHKHVKQLQKLF